MVDYKKTGLNLRVTCRPNVRVSTGWTYPLLDEYLDLIEKSIPLEETRVEYLQLFLHRDVLHSDSGEPMGDGVITHTFLDEPFKEQFRLRKQSLAVVNYFGHFLPPSTHMVLQGPGNGLVVLDIDLKGLGREIPEPFLELLEQELLDYFYAHLCTVFLYVSSSTLGYHIGFLTDAATPVQYKVVFEQLVRNIKQGCPRLAPYVDEGVGHYTRAFYTSHSSYVLRKKPLAMFLTETKEVEQLERSLLKQVEEATETVYQAFPYHMDIRLFLAFQRRAAGVYFDKYQDWLTMLYALKATYPICYLERLQYWFETLSGLSPKFNPADDFNTFQGILDQDTLPQTGVDFIINHLANGAVTTQYPTYSWEEAISYSREVFGKMDVANSEDSDQLEIDSYLTEIKEDLPLEEQDVILDAPPGCGKTTLVLEAMKGKRILLLPTLVLMEDVYTKVPEGTSYLMVKGEIQPEQIWAADVILCTYEGLGKILASNINKTAYTLIVDEAHNLFVSASPTFRFASLNRIVSSFNRFNNVVLLSGTWIQYPIALKNFRHIKVRKRNAPEPVLEMVNTPNPLNSLAEDVVQESGKQIVLINNKALNWQLERLIKKYSPDSPVIVINSDTKDTVEVRQRLEKNELQVNEKLVGTQMIIEGISFTDPDIKSMLFFQNLLPEHMAQLCFRARASADPQIKYYYARQSFKLSASADYSYAYQKVKAAFEALNLQEFPREKVKDTTLLIYYQQSGRGKSAQKLYTPYLTGEYMATAPQVNSLLLGYYALKEVGQALNSDLLSLLAHLRQWNFSFGFSTMGVSTIREDFKRLEAEEQRALIRDHLPTVARLSGEELNHREQDAVYKAWCLLQCVDTGYFLSLSEEERESQFTDKKKYQELVEQVLACALMEGHTFSKLEPFASKKFMNTDAKILLKMRGLPCYEGRIYHDDFDETIARWGVSGSEVARVMKKYYDKSPSKPTTVKGVRKRYFELSNREFGFIGYIKHENMTEYDSPF